jgi:DNA-binding NarL/FixJ family response regulator
MMVTMATSITAETIRSRRYAPLEPRAIRAAKATVSNALAATMLPRIRIVILTTFDDRELIHAGMQAGAQGYVLKDITAEQLATTIRGVAQGQVLLHPDVANEVFGSFTETAPIAHTGGLASHLSQLTEREQEILALLARGASNREISETLFIAAGTVKNHLSNILGKLGVRDRTQAALKARELGLL